MLQINTLTRLDLGVKQENLARDLYIDMSAWISEYPNGTITVWHKRNGDETKYAVGGATFDRDTNILKWTPTEYDTFYTGQGLCEIRLTENDVIKKTKDIITETARSLMLGSGETLEAGWQSLVNTISGYASDAEDAQTAAEDAQDAAEDAQQAAEDARDAAQAATVHEPTIDDVSGNWLVWSQDDGEYVDTGVHAQGPQGEPGSIENVRATGIKMSMVDDTTVYDAINARADKVENATSGNFAALDENGNLTDSGHKDSDYLKQHQDISGKADKVSSATNGNFAALDSNGNLTDSGHKDSDYLKQHQDISGKADKVSSATSGNFAGLDANGNLTDSGHKDSDYLKQHQDISGKADKVSGATSGDFAELDANGNLTDSGKKAGDFATANEIGIVVNGNKSAVAATTGQYVILRNSTITGKTDGLYTAAQAIPANTAIDGTYLTEVSGGGLNALGSAVNTKITTIHPTTELGTMSDLVSLLNENASGLFVNCRIGSTIVNKLCGVSARQGTINAFKSNASSDYIEYTVIDTEAVVYTGYYKISTDTATYDQLALNSDLNNRLITVTGENATKIPSNSDINDYGTGGAYIIQTDAVAATISNLPRNASGRLIVVPEFSDRGYYVNQFYMPSTSYSNIYTRKYDNSAWKEWCQLACVKMKEDTYTTSGGGNINTGFYVSGTVVLAAIVIDRSDTIAHVSTWSGQGANASWGLHITDLTMAPVASTSVKVRIYYMDFLP